MRFKPVFSRIEVFVARIHVCVRSLIKTLVFVYSIAARMEVILSNIYESNLSVRCDEDFGIVGEDYFFEQ